MIEPESDPIYSRTRASLMRVIVILFGIALICVGYQYETIKKTIRMRIFDISSDHIVRKEEIKAITNQAVIEIDNRRQESLDVIDNKAKEVLVNSTDADVVPADVLKAVNKARRETR